MTRSRRSPVLLVLLLLGAVLVAVRRRRPTAPPSALTAPPTTAVPLPPAAAVPPAMDAPPVDDLQRIEGIGPKIAGVLTAAGITGWAALAGCDEPRLREVLAGGGVRLAPSVATWPAQAALLAAGDESGFTELTARLKGGRRR